MCKIIITSQITLDLMDAVRASVKDLSDFIGVPKTRGFLFELLDRMIDDDERKMG